MGINIEKEDVIKLIRDIYAKVEGADNLLKDGKIIIVHDKLIGLKQKLAHTAKCLEEEKGIATAITTATTALESNENNSNT